MKFFFKILIAFLIVFSWRIPYLYNTVFLSILITTVYYIFNNKRITFTYFFQRYTAVILIGTVAIAFVIFIITLFHNTNIMCNIQKRMWVVLSMLWAMIYVFPLLIEDNKKNAYEEICTIICYAFALQGLIHLSGFLYEPLGEFLFEMKPEGYKEKVLNPRFNVAKFRLYCLSGIVFVELVAAYGVAFILFFRLQLNNSSHRYLKGWVRYIVLFFLITGTSLAGRTGFVGLGLGILFWIFFSYRKIFSFLEKNIIYIIISIVVLLFSYSYLLPVNQRNMLQTEVFPFAFEWYFNYEETGTLNVRSLEATGTQYYYLSDETLLWGHGETFERANFPYPPSDAGYMNNLIFGGIPYLVCLIIYQSLYFISPISRARQKNTFINRVDIALFLLFFFYILLLSYKTTAIGTIQIVETLLLAAGLSYLIQHYSQNQNESLS